MRYHYVKPFISTHIYGEIYWCEHPVYDRCTLFMIENKGLAVIQQRFNPETKTTYWSEIDDCLANDIYNGFLDYFNKRSGVCSNGLFPTVTVRQIMWALKIKPLDKERWETVFDRRDV
jgi:hypothetical protein